MNKWIISLVLCLAACCTLSACTGETTSSGTPINSAEQDVPTESAPVPSPSATPESDSASAVGAGIATALVFPHLICTGLAVVFNILGWAMSHRGFALTAGILYSVAMILFPMYFAFVVIEAVLCYVGFAKLKKLNVPEKEA